MTGSKRRPVHADRLALGAWIAVALTPAGWVLGIVLAFLSGEGEAKGIGPVTPGMAAGLLFADGDISAKLVGYGGLWLVALASLIIAYAVGTSVLQRGDALTAAGLATMATNAVPIAAVFVLFGETLVPAPVDQAVHPQPRGVVDPAPHGTGSGHHDVRPGPGLCGGTRPLLRRARRRPGCLDGRRHRVAVRCRPFGGGEAAGARQFRVPAGPAGPPGAAPDRRAAAPGKPPPGGGRIGVHARSFPGVPAGTGRSGMVARDQGGRQRRPGPARHYRGRGCIRPDATAWVDHATYAGRGW